MEIRTNNRTALLFLLVLLLSMAVGASRCAKITKANEMPPLYLEYFLPSIHNHPTSIGLPPESIE